MNSLPDITIAVIIFTQGWVTWNCPRKQKWYRNILFHVSTSIHNISKKRKLASSNNLIEFLTYWVVIPLRTLSPHMYCKIISQWLFGSAHECWFVLELIKCRLPVKVTLFKRRKEDQDILNGEESMIGRVSKLQLSSQPSILGIWYLGPF